MTLVTISGAEEGITAQGLAATQSRIWSISAGTTTIDTTTFRSGAKSYKFAAAATLPYIGRTCAASQSVVYFRGYFYLTDATPASGPMYLVLAVAAASPNSGLNVSTGGVLTAQFTTGESQTGPTLSDNTWYGVEMEFDYSANPSVIRWRTWDSGTGWTARTDVTKAQAADTINSLRFGRPSGGPTATLDTYFDDILIGEGTTTGGDYNTSSSQGGKVLRYLPTADGTHSAFTSGDFKYNNSTNIANSATDVYTYVDDDDQTSLADYIAQAVAGAGKYVQVTFADEGTETQPRAVAVTSTHHSSTTGANEMHLRVSDDGTNWTNVWGDWASAGLDTSDTSAHYLHKVLTAKPSSGSWTQSAVNGMRVQWGNSDDVVGVPFLDSVSLQVEWTEGAATTTVVDPFGMSGFFGV